MYVQPNRINHRFLVIEGYTVQKMLACVGNQKQYEFNIVGWGRNPRPPPKKQ